MNQHTSARNQGVDLPSLLFVPGLACDDAVWSRQIGALAETAECMVADVSCDDSIEGMASRALRNAPSRFALAGLSMGGYVALEMMRQAPERVTRLALLDTKASQDSAEQAEGRQQGMVNVRDGGFDTVIAGFPPLLFHEARLSDDALIDEHKAMAHRVGAATFLRQQTAIMNRPDSVPILGDITCPTLIVCGRDDVLTPVEDSELMASKIPGARLAVLEQCGHMSPWEKPKEVNNLLYEWLTNGPPTHL